METTKIQISRLLDWSCCYPYLSCNRKFLFSSFFAAVAKNLILFNHYVIKMFNHSMQSGEHRLQPQEIKESLRNLYSSNRHNSIIEGINQQINPQEPIDSFARFYIIHAKHQDSAHPQFSGNSLHKPGKQKGKGKQFPQNRKTYFSEIFTGWVFIEDKGISYYVSELNTRIKEKCL